MQHDLHNDPGRRVQKVGWFVVPPVLHCVLSAILIAN